MYIFFNIVLVEKIFINIYFYFQLNFKSIYTLQNLINLLIIMESQSKNKKFSNMNNQEIIDEAESLASAMDGQNNEEVYAKMLNKLKVLQNVIAKRIAEGVIITQSLDSRIQYFKNPRKDFIFKCVPFYSNFESEMFEPYIRGIIKKSYVEINKGKKEDLKIEIKWIFHDYIWVTTNQAVTVENLSFTVKEKIDPQTKEKKEGFKMYQIRKEMFLEDAYENEHYLATGIKMNK